MCWGLGKHRGALRRELLIREGVDSGRSEEARGSVPGLEVRQGRPSWRG